MCSNICWQNEQGHTTKTGTQAFGNRTESRTLGWLDESGPRGEVTLTGGYQCSGIKMQIICNRKNIDFLEVSLALKEKCVKLNRKKDDDLTKKTQNVSISSFFLLN